MFKGTTSEVPSMTLASSRLIFSVISKREHSFESVVAVWIEHSQQERPNSPERTK
jgi:hypothetical protein